MRMKLLNLSLIVFIQLLLSGGLHAYHIIGGETTFKCLGNDNYEITILMYRDCATTLGADFDSKRNEPLATVTVWRDDLFDPFITTINLKAPSVTRVKHSDYNPCMEIPPNTCVEKGVYVFTVNLPRSAFSYHVVYQRCCRSGSVLNIEFPTETGATFQVEITPEAQRECIDSPMFKELPPMVMCVGYPIEFNQSVINTTPSTTIEYALCTPYAGGGPISTTTGAMGYDGITPNPDSRPPYELVTYRPGYSAQNPVKAGPQLSIDRNTGIITGTPEVVGEFVVGVCVIQKKNGRIISEIKRDFHLNVVECERMVEAIVGGPMLDRSGERILSCGGKSVFIKNHSRDEEFIKSMEWEFMENGNLVNLKTEDFEYTFADTGVYDVKLYLNRGLSACDDEANVRVEIRNPIHSRFSIAGDTCEAESVYVSNNSFSENGSITSWAWTFEEGNTSNLEQPAFNFQSPGDKNVQLIVRDKYSCADTSSRIYPYYPRPSVVDVALRKDLLCTDSPIHVRNKSYPIDSTYQVNWYLSNGDFYTGLEPEFTFTEEGMFDLTLEIISPLGCTRIEDYENYFEVWKNPIADFDYNPKELSQYDKSVDFINYSEYADLYRWYFDEDGSSTDKNPFFIFPDTGFKVVTLYSESLNGCIDSMIQILDVEPLTTYFVPNAFTPNEDGVNDGFRGVGYLPYIENFRMQIYTRWGEVIFETEDPTEEWNGQVRNTGKRLPQGVYVVKVQYTDPRGVLYNQKAYVTLLD